MRGFVGQGRFLLVLCIITTSAAAAFTPITTPNMNGGENYLLQRTPRQQGKSTWSTQFKDYPGGVEEFTVMMGPITTTYGEVFWKALPEVELPAELQKRFAGKGMAIVGFEADQVRRTPQGDVPVPINIAYNHHYGAQLLGAGSRMERVRVEDLKVLGAKRAMHPGPDPGWAEVPVEHTPSPTGLPTSMVFGYSNGGEYRKTYHGLATPFAQVVSSPTRVAVTPMQIDTWHREKMNLTGSAFVAGPGD